MSKHFFEKMNEARKNKRISLKELSLATGISIGHLSEAERGLTNLGGDKLLSVCRALGISINPVPVPIVSEPNGLGWSTVREEVRDRLDKIVKYDGDIPDEVLVELDHVLSNLAQKESVKGLKEELEMLRKAG
jgi:transcriptional regulator with XRE-family HTH domain